MNEHRTARYISLAAILVAPMIFSGALMATPPAARAVPFLATNPTSPHTSWSGNTVTLKGDMLSSACDPNSATGNCTDSFTYDWDPGDGGTHCTGSVSNIHVIECVHTYTGSVGSLFTAVLTVTDTSTSQVSPASNCPPSITQGACYYTSLNPGTPNLQIEVNNAIDNGLWFVHKSMVRTTSAYGAPIGNWWGAPGNANVAGAGDTGPSSIYCTAIEVSGFTPVTVPASPYTDDANLCVAGVFDILTPISIGDVSTYSIVTAGQYTTIHPDQNNNGIGVTHDGGAINYETGMQMDALVAANDPTAAVPAGTQLGNLAAGLGRSLGADHTYRYQDAIQDMVDGYAYCESPNGDPFTSSGGGWFYTCQQNGGDNSISQWAAIGIIPARRKAGALIDSSVLTADQKWLGESFNQLTFDNTTHKGQGEFGYSDPGPAWGPYATTPGGMVQLAMNGKGRGSQLYDYQYNRAAYLWDSAETFIRDTFSNPQYYGAGSSLKAYYYGMFSFTKSMLLHDTSGTGLGNTPIQYLHSSDDPRTCTAGQPYPLSSPGSGSSPCYPDIDWYAAQTAAYGGTDPTDGVARTIVGNQQSDGSWYGQNYVDNQNYFQTASSIIMLNHTVFQAVPVACFTANPSQFANGGTTTLTSCSYDQDPTHNIVSYQWDVSGSAGSHYTISAGNAACVDPQHTCSQISYAFTTGSASFPYNYAVSLKVTNNVSLTASTTGNVVLAYPPNPPTASAGGPYSFCPNKTPFTLDGSQSTNPDNGLHDNTSTIPGAIVAYDWDYSCSSAFNSAHGAQVDASSAFNQSAYYGTTFNVCLRVTNNDQLAFPSSGLSGGLTSVASAKVTIHTTTDAQCVTGCVTNVGGSAKAPTPGTNGSIQLGWTDTNSVGAPFDHYNIYRSTSTTFQGATVYATKAVPAVAGSRMTWVDFTVTAGVTYYYRVVPTTSAGVELCPGHTFPSLDVVGVTALKATR